MAQQGYGHVELSYASKNRVAHVKAFPAKQVLSASSCLSACRRVMNESPGRLKNSAVAFNKDGRFLGVGPVNLGKLTPALRC